MSKISEEINSIQRLTIYKISAILFYVYGALQGLHFVIRHARA
jgi:hypothetical protein